MPISSNKLTKCSWERQAGSCTSKSGAGRHEASLRGRITSLIRFYGTYGIIAADVLKGFRSLSATSGPAPFN